MSTTVAEGASFVNPVSAYLGTGSCDLYDWRKIVPRLGRIRRHMDLSPPVSRYEQVAARLRERIMSGEFPAGSRLPSGAQKDEYPVSQPVVQRAFEVLEREGLVRMEPGRGTTVLSRDLWRIEFGAGPLENAEAEAARVATALSNAAAAQPAMTSARAEALGDGVRVIVTVEAAELGGAVTAALPVVRAALGPLAVKVMSATAA